MISQPFSCVPSIEEKSLQIVVRISGDHPLALLSRKHAHKTSFVFGPNRSSFPIALLLLPKWEKQGSFIFCCC